jgi:YegS/Rv2252/BmrU family lipid kinase
MGSAAVIINPIAGAARGRLTPKGAVELLGGLGIETEVIVTRLAGGGAELAAQAATRHPLVAVAGGDGTVSEVARGLMGTDAVMVLLPCGSGNDFANGLGIGSPRDGAAAAVSGRIVTVDACWFADRFFINSCGLFFNGEVSLRAADVSRRWGRLRYPVATMGLITAYRSPVAHWRFDPGGVCETTLDGRWLLAEIGNGTRCGGGFRLTPQADPSDGLLDFCLVRDMNAWQRLRILPRGASGSHLGNPRVVYPRVSSAEVTVPETLAVHWDGEAERIPAGTYRFRLDPGRVKVAAPAVTATEC